MLRNTVRRQVEIEVGSLQGLAVEKASEQVEADSEQNGEHNAGGQRHQASEPTPLKLQVARQAAEIDAQSRQQQDSRADDQQRCSQDDKNATEIGHG